MLAKQIVEERRSHVRAKRVLSIEFRLSKSSRKSADSNWHLSTTQDMSIGGLSFYTDGEYKIGDILEIHVVMSGILDIFNGFGRVVRVEKKRSGTYFLIAIKYINNKLNNRKAKSYQPAKSRIN